MKTKNLITDSNEDVFSFRLNKVESVGLATTESGNNYLLLDSIDYWYDIIQEHYPSELKCGCGSKLFRAKLVYHTRSSSHSMDDFSQIDLITACTTCNTEKKQMAVEIKYSPNGHLYRKPLVFCKKPKIKYHLSDYTAFWTPSDLIFLLDEARKLGCVFHVWRFNANGRRSFGALDYDDVCACVDSGKFLEIHLSKKGYSVDLTDTPEGPYVPGNGWRRKEVIIIHSPFNMCYGDVTGYLYRINYCTDYIQNETIATKSKDFLLLTKEFEGLLSHGFSSRRGRNCFDSERELIRIFGQKYR
ncbi:MAG TPA: hypothetical protein PKK43_04410 [Spirochaetota bacterium]|nr:hypothetical protein [Spirochaetota bacterium]